LLLGFITVLEWLPQRSMAAAFDGAAFFAAIFFCVLLHEFGHALMARRYGIGTRDIMLLPIGGVARLERMPDKPSQELWVALAGPAVNVAIAAALAAGLWVSGGGSMPPLTLNTQGGQFIERLLAVNVFLVVFNLLPAFPMDGGRVLRALLALRLTPVRATRIAATIGQGMAFVFGFMGLFGNPLLLLIAVFVWFGAAGEASAAEMKSSFAGVPVREAMITEFHALSPDNTVGETARLLLKGTQQEFPVVAADGALLGIMTHRRLFEALREQGEDTPVRAVMDRAYTALETADPLIDALARRDPEGCLTMPVFSRGRLVGLITPENIGEFFMIRSALDGREGRPPRFGGGLFSGGHSHAAAVMPTLRD
jgi:Zn-dependent protease